MNNEIEYAGLGERFLALLVDALLFCACFFPVTRIVKGVWLMSPNDHNWVRGWFISDPLCLAFLVIMGLYFVVLEGWFGATLGKWMLGLRVIDLDGGRAGLWKGALRNILRLVDGLPVFSLLGVILIQRSRERARFGDRIAGTRVIRASRHSRTFPWRSLIVPGGVMAVFWSLAIVAWRSSGYTQPLVMFGYIGTSLGVGLGLYGTLPKKQKPIGRRLTLCLVGLFLVGFAILVGRENVQIEGFLFGLLTGVIQMGVIHYFIAKIIGPVLFGRLWCGWACWTVMVLDLLPFKRPSGRIPGRWGWLRYLHFGLSLTLVFLLVFVVGFRDGATGTTAVTWFIVGNLAYYAAGIVLAYTLKDNRAFCKYLCPVSVPLKITSRVSLLKIGGSAEKCNGCGACVKMCPMDVRIPEYVRAGQRVLSTECSLCQTCITVCPRDALKLSFGFDLGGRELLREQAVHREHAESVALGSK